MRRLAIPFCLVACLGCGAAAAAPKVTVKTTSFDIAGRTGADLLRELDKRGPKHGFLTRAIAQTRYQLNSGAEFKYARGVCSVVRPAVRLDITYIYPRLTGSVPSSLRKRWNAFMAGVKKHEETHGRIARQMAVEAEQALSRLKARDDSGCTRIRSAMKRTVDGIVDKYEMRQRQFDEAEHRDNGPVARLVSRLGG